MICAADKTTVLWAFLDSQFSRNPKTTRKFSPVILQYAPNQHFAMGWLCNLSIIHDAGVGMERLPSTYAQKQEEDLRDYLLIPLCTHYPNSTGETFNKKGKTDILISHQGSNVFVGECKFWQGLKAFFETIDQILGYLTWRDSKAAILCFVKNIELNPQPSHRN